MMSGSVHFQMLLNWHGLINCVQHVAFTPSPMKEKSLLTRASPEQLRIHWLSQSRGCRPAPLPPPLHCKPLLTLDFITGVNHVVITPLLTKEKPLLTRIPLVVSIT